MFRDWDAIAQSGIERLDFRIRNNADWIQPFEAYDYDPETNSRSPHNLSGASLRMQLHEVLHSEGGRPAIATTAAIDASTENGEFVIASDPTTGAFNLVVPAAIMFGVSAGLYAGDCLIFGANGSVTTAFTLVVELEAGDTPPTSATI